MKYFFHIVSILHVHYMLISNKNMYVCLSVYHPSLYLQECNNQSTEISKEKQYKKNKKLTHALLCEKVEPFEVFFLQSLIIFLVVLLAISYSHNVYIRASEKLGRARFGTPKMDYVSPKIVCPHWRGSQVSKEKYHSRYDNFDRSGALISKPFNASPAETHRLLIRNLSACFDCSSIKTYILLSHTCIYKNNLK